jgi:tRNA threonylcarbamoyl adenosine modification protein YeaZ
MKILSLDTSSPVASVAVVGFANGDPKILFESKTPHARSDSSALFGGLKEAVDAWGSPDALCVGLGPGSYNGLRASIAAARAFATGLGITLHGVPSPLGLPGPESGFWALGDARGGHYWIAAVKEERFLSEPTLLMPGEIPRHRASFPDFPMISGGPLPGIENILHGTPNAVRLAIIAKKHDPSFLFAGTPDPLYLKPPHITSPRPTAA